MQERTKIFFLKDESLETVAILGFGGLGIVGFCVSWILTHYANELVSWFPSLIMQCYLLLLLVVLYLKWKWRPVNPFIKRGIASGFILILGYLVLLVLFEWSAAQMGMAGAVWKAGSSFPVFLLSVVGAPIVEELFFRDLLFRVLSGRWNSLWLGAVVSSALFMIAHFSLYPGAFLLGCISCYLYVATQSISPSILFHVVSNLSIYFLPICFPHLAGFLTHYGLVDFFYR